VTCDNSILEMVSIFLQRCGWRNKQSVAVIISSTILCALYNAKSMQLDFEYHLVLPAL